MHAVTYEHGVRLPGTPLWFDAEGQRELCILTGLGQRLPPPHRRVLTSPALAQALEQMGYGGSVLPSPWERWVGVGGHRVQLIDAQAAPGGAAVLIGADDAPLLMTGMLRAHAAPWPRAEHVVARLPALRHGGRSLGEVAGQVAGAIAARRGRATVWVDSLEVGLALHGALWALGVVTKPLGLLGKMVAPAPVAGPSPALAMARPAMRFEAGAIRVSAGLLPWLPSLDGRDVAPPIKVRWYADLAALQGVLTISRARRVSLIDVPRSVEAAVTTALGSQVRVQFLGAPVPGADHPMGPSLRPPTCGISQRS